MRYLTFSNSETGPFEVCFLVPILNEESMRRHYIKPHLAGQIREEHLLAYNLYKNGKKTKAAEMREYLTEKLLPTLETLRTNYLVVCDGDYFKVLTKSAKIEPYIGYVLPCTIPGYEHLHVVYCPNFQAVFHDPQKVNDSIRISLQALVNHYKGEYQDPGLDVIKKAYFPNTLDDIRHALDSLLDLDRDLSADIEAFSLKHHNAGIGTIAFAWSKHEGVAFPVDLHPQGKAIRALLKDFFLKFRHRMLWHNISYDVYVLVYQLFMSDILDTEGLLHGLDVLLRNWDDTKLITYLATNSCAGNKLSLKAQAQEFAGNYAVEEIDDIRQIPLPKLLQYNLVDALSTWFVYEKHWDTLVADQQLEIYETLFKPAIWDIIQMQLTGLPIDIKEVEKAAIELQGAQDDAVARIQSNPVVFRFLHEESVSWVDWKNSTLKKKRVTLADSKVTFNPNSAPQLQRLLYEVLELPVLDLTDSKLPATGGETLAKLKNHTEDPEILDLLDALVDYKTVNKFITDFLPSFQNAVEGPDGWHYLFGNFNLGGTVSGRLSSSKPNLQNLPSNGNPLLPKKKIYAKMLKRCVKAPPGWLFCGLDFFSLEDRISALTTKDPNKLKVYTDGYDGHCLRAFSYFGEQMPDIDPKSVESINSIEMKYPALRQDSKGPTFALTYQGTWITLVNNSGFSDEMAKQIESRYHELYRVSDEWVAQRLADASRDGYITAAFGLRVRTPLLHQVIRGTSKTPFEAEAEGRTAGNALGQSWCLLNSRAGVEFNQTVRASIYRLLIRPCAQIHDAQYFLIRNDLDVIQFTNKHLVKAVEWQDHPDIWHDEVKLGGELSIFYPSWAEECGIPNGASVDQILAKAEEHALKHCPPPIN